MTTRLVLAPAAGGKTQHAIECIAAALAAAPLSPTWVVVPDRNQERAFRLRLAQQGTIGANVVTFGDLHAEILAEVGSPFPLCPEALIHRLIRTAVDDLAVRGQIVYYLPIQRRPGLVSILADLFAELKRARINPERFSAVVGGCGPRLEELAALYHEYQARLLRLGWSDHEGLGWLAVSAVEGNPSLGKTWRLLVADGFDSFNPTQLALLRALAPRVGETVVTLTGEPTMTRSVHRRFARALAVLREALSPDIEVLPRRSHPVPALAHLEANLFLPGALRQPAGLNVSFMEAQTMALEAREALRWLKARIVRDHISPEQCAVVARDIGLYRVFLREAAREFGLPLRLACGEPLVTNPAIAAVLGLLELPLQDWKRRPLLDAVRSPYFDLSAFGLSPADAARLDEVARAGQVVGGIEQWREALLQASKEQADDVDLGEEDARPPRLPTGSAALSLLGSLEAFCRRVTPPVKGSLTTYVQWIEDLLGDEDGLRLSHHAGSQPDTAARDAKALTAFATVLGALVLGESVVGPPKEMSYAEFYSELRAALAPATYRWDDAIDPQLGYIYAADLTTARGVSYRAVAMLGLSEGLFPSPVVEDPLLSDEERADLSRRGVSLEPRLRSDQQTLFYEGVTRATQYLLLSRPYLGDDGEAWEPSPFWSAARAVLDAPVRRVRLEDRRSEVEAASVSELLAWSVRHGALPKGCKELTPEWERLRRHADVLRARLGAASTGEDEGRLDTVRPELQSRYGPEHIWSSSRLETYAACPFWFFTAFALRLEERIPPKPGYDAAQLGSILHKILERVYAEAKDPTNLTELLEILPHVAGMILQDAPAIYGFRPTVLWETLQTELQEALSKTLQGLAECRGQFRPTHFELEFGTGDRPPLQVAYDGETVLLHGIIDRVDRDDRGNVRVIDYKSADSGLRPLDLCEGRRLQLPLYALAVERCLNLGIPVDGFYWAILKGEMGKLQLGKFRHQTQDGRVYQGTAGAMALAVEHVVAYVRAIRDGSFAPAPSGNVCKDYCPARLFCWRYQPTHY